MGKRKSQPRGGGFRPFPTSAKSGESRSGEDRFLYGVHAVLAALANPARRNRRLLLTAEAGRALESRLAELRQRGVRLPEGERADRAELDRLAGSDAVHQGVVLETSPLPELTLDDVLDRLGEAKHAVVVVLDQPNDPHNLGAIIRSAAAFGAAAVIVPERGTAPASATVAKAASGALEWLPLVRIGNLVRALETLKAAGFWSIGLDGDSATSLADSDLSGRTALVLGAEGPGLRRLTRETCDSVCHIPTAGSLASLNLSNAAAVALYEAARQRTATN